MAKQQQVQKQTNSTAPEEMEVVQPQVKTAEEQEAFDQEIGDLLDEIEDVLEENAQDFIASYIQKGGE